MNRIASLLAGTVTTALSGAAVAGLAASEGLFAPEAAPAPSETTVAAAEATRAWAPATAHDASGAEGAQPVTRIVYVDKEPVVHVREVVVPTSAGSSAGGTDATASPSAPPAVSTPAAPPSPPAAAAAPSTPPASPATPVAESSPPSSPPPFAPAVSTPSADPPPTAAEGPGDSGSSGRDEDHDEGHDEHENEDDHSDEDTHKGDDEDKHGDEDHR